MFHDDTGSVAEWVLLVVLAAILVGAVLTVTSPVLQDLVKDALSKITPG